MMDVLNLRLPRIKKYIVDELNARAKSADELQDMRIEQYEEQMNLVFICTDGRELIIAVTLQMFEEAIRSAKALH